VPSVLHHVKAGKLRALGVISTRRSASAPEYAPIAEQGVANYEAASWHGALAPKGLPEALLKRLNRAINAALIAGNREPQRLERVKQFWDRVAHPDAVDMSAVSDQVRQSNIWFNTLDTVMRGAPGFFSPRMFSGFPFGMPVPPEQASFYDTCPLQQTLRELVDFDYLNAGGGIRLTVNAVNVRTGELKRFDSVNGDLCADHVRASGSLPPAFPPVRIDGELYWDGGLYSNTPLESVLGDKIRQPVR